LGSTGQKISQNDDLIRIQILKEGKSYSRQVKLSDAKKAEVESAFTSQYNAQK